MATEQELEAIMLDLESDRVERKSSLSDRDKIREAICAFANDLPDHRLPGYILVGVKDDGSPASFPITDQVLLTLAEMRQDMQPFATMTVQKRLLHGHEVAVVEIFPAYNPPVRFNGRVCVRVGPRRATASAEEERRLVEKRQAGDLPFDQHPVIGATLADLDLVLFQRVYLPSAVAPETLAENRRTIEQQLASLHFLAKDGTPNVGAILTLGNDPRAFIPGAYVQFVRIEGKDLTDPLKDQKDISEPLPDLMHDLDELLTANITVRTDFTSGPLEIQQPDYPIVALQQILRNAIMHRTYEGTAAPVRLYWYIDRIEIISPGGPYGMVTIQNFGKAGVTDYRNPLVAEAMKALRYVQKFGVGIAQAKKALRQNGNPPPKFRVETTGITVVIRRKR